MDPVLKESPQTLAASRWDLFAFVGAFITGLIAYFGFRWGLKVAEFEPNFIQLIVTASIVAVMLIYAFVVAKIPRLRVRLDQAGDNAYYLGLLFTLMSMAVALWEFGRIVLSDGTGFVQESGARQIIANFGVALASTITGIFLRVILHQMRVDPADVESMTRIELAEASKRVRASLDDVTSDLGRFHDEVRQRTADVLKTLMQDTTQFSKAMSEDVQRATHEMIESTQNTQRSVLERTSELAVLLGDAAAEALGAVERLKAVEPPPLLLAKRLERLSHSLESIGEQVKRMTTDMDGTAGTAVRAVNEMTKVVSSLGSISKDFATSQADAGRAVTGAVARVGIALDQVGVRLVNDRTLLAELEAQSRRSAEATNQAQEASVEVLTRLTEMTRALANVLKTHSPVPENARPD